MAVELSDQSDAVPRVRPAYPQIRLWPDDIPKEWGRPEDFPQIISDSPKRRIPLLGRSDIGFEMAAAPLSAIYVPERVSRREFGGSLSEICRIEPLSPAAALLALIGTSFAAEFLEDIGIQGDRLRTLSTIVSSVPVKRLVYCDGKSHLPSVIAAVQADCTSGAAV